MSCGVVLFIVDSKKINRSNLRSTLVIAFLWFKFCRSTLESCFCVNFRFYQFSSKILIRKKKHENLSVNHSIHVVLQSCTCTCKNYWELIIENFELNVLLNFLDIFKKIIQKEPSDLDKRKKYEKSHKLAGKLVSRKKK